MSAGLEFLPEATVEVEEATRYYEERVPGLGARFRLELMSVCTAVERHLSFGVSVLAGFDALTFPGSHFTSPILFATSEPWSPPLHTPAVIQITGNHVTELN